MSGFRRLALHFLAFVLALAATEARAVDGKTKRCLATLGEGARTPSRLAKASAKDLQPLSLAVTSLGGYNRIAKFLIDVRDPSAPKLMFFDTGKYRIHHDFATAELGYQKSLEAFQEFNYTGSYRDREFILASLAIKEAPNEKPNAMIELFSGDDMDPETIRMMTDLVNENVTDFSSVKFHPLSDFQEAAALKALAAGRVTLTRDLAAGLTYLPLNQGTAVGYVRVVSKEDYDAGRVLLGPSDIAVFDRAPNDIGLVSGVVTDEVQTALSHINVKSVNRGTPNMYLKDASKTLRPYDGKPVVLEAGEHGVSVKAIDEAEAERRLAAFWKSRRKTLLEKPASIIDPRNDGKLLDLTTYYTRLPTREEHRKLIQTVGAKAANNALVHFIAKSRKLKVVVPDVVAAPFNGHEAFFNLRQAGLDPRNPKRKMTLNERIHELLSEKRLLDPDKVHQIQVVADTLRRVRETILRAQVPDEMMAAYKRAIHDDPKSPIHRSKHARLRLRSSTNSEDMEGFTGAGLYDSYGVNLFKKLPGGGYDRTKPRKWKKIEEDLRVTIPRNYASIFNDRAFMEREWFGINGALHLRIKEGIAIHGAFPFKTFDGELGEVGNGVAITTDLYKSKSDYPKIFINSQHFDLPITNPPEAADLLRVGEAGSTRGYSTDEVIVSTYLANFAEEASAEGWKKWPVDRIRKSSVKGGESVLKSAETAGELRELAHAIRVINEDMAKVFGVADVDDFPIDVEFKIYGKDRTIYIKQARPFVRPAAH